LKLMRMYVRGVASPAGVRVVLNRRSVEPRKLSETLDQLTGFKALIAKERDVGQPTWANGSSPTDRAGPLRKFFALDHVQPADARCAI
jgi:hypothetical protein